MDSTIRIIIADDEKPARKFLSTLLQSFEYVELIGEAENGEDAVALIDKEQPDLVLLDLHMPAMNGLEVVQSLKVTPIPLITFVTTYDEYAIRAFELNTINYLLKPVDKTRLRETLQRAQERLERPNSRTEEAAHLEAAFTDYATVVNLPLLERIPVRHKGDIIIVPVNQIISIIADRELLKITTNNNENYTINYRLKDLALRLDPKNFVRLGRGALVNINAIKRINHSPSGNYTVFLSNNQQIKVSRLQSRSLRDRLLRL